MNGKNEDSEVEVLGPEEEQPLSLVPVTDKLPTNPVEMLAVAVTSGRLDTESLKELMELEKEYRGMQAKVQFDKAVAKFAGLKQRIPHNQIGKAAQATFGYADYPQTVETITPWLKKAGLSFSHSQDDPVMDGAKIVFVNVRCHLKAKSGHSEEAQYPAIPDEKLRDKMAPGQLLQLAITYAQRQSLKMVLGLSTGEEGVFDDDSSEMNGSSADDFFPDETFQKNLPKWTEMIKSGDQNVGAIMNLISSKGKLTDSQKQTLRSIKA